MLTVVTWKWTTPGYRSTFTGEHVNTLRAMVARNYKRPHRFVCVTDERDGIESDIEIIPDFKDFVNVPHPQNRRNPSCYRRLRMFAPDIDRWFGPRFISLDLDCVVSGDLSPVFDRTEDFIIWGNTNRDTFYNGSMVMMTAGARSRVWTTFHPQRSPALSKAAGQFGSDQGWISACLGPGEKKWTRADGVLSFRNDIVNHLHGPILPRHARIIFFHGNDDPWMPTVQRKYPWIAKFYRR